MMKEFTPTPSYTLNTMYDDFLQRLMQQTCQNDKAATIQQPYLDTYSRKLMDGSVWTGTLVYITQELPSTPLASVRSIPNLDAGHSNGYLPVYMNFWAGQNRLEFGFTNAVAWTPELSYRIPKIALPHDRLHDYFTTMEGQGKGWYAHADPSPLGDKKTTIVPIGDSPSLDDLFLTSAQKGRLPGFTNEFLL